MKEFHLGSSSHRFYVTKGWSTEDGQPTGLGPAFRIIDNPLQPSSEVTKEEPQIEPVSVSIEEPIEATEEALEELTEHPEKHEEAVRTVKWGESQYKGKEVSEGYMKKLLNDIDNMNHRGGNYPSVDLIIEQNNFTLRHIQIMFNLSRGTVIKLRDTKQPASKQKQRECFKEFVRRNPSAAINSIL